MSNNAYETHNETHDPDRSLKALKEHNNK